MDEAANEIADLHQDGYLTDVIIDRLADEITDKINDQSKLSNNPND